MRILYLTDSVYGWRVSLLSALGQKYIVVFAFWIRRDLDSMLKSRRPQFKVLHLKTVPLMGNIEVPRMSQIPVLIREVMASRALILEDIQNKVPYFFAFAVAKLMKKRILNVTTLNGFSFDRRPAFLVASVLKFAITMLTLRASNIVAETDASENFLLRTGIYRSVVSGGAHFRPCVDTKNFAPNSRLRSKTRSELGIGESEIVVLYAGGNRVEKGFHTLLSAIKMTPPGRLRFVLISVGPRLELSEDMRVRSDVIVIDAVEYNEMPLRYSLADIVVVPSITGANRGTDNSPNVIIEAMASGCAVLATRVGGIPSLAGDAALYFEEGNPEDLVAKLLTLSNPSVLQDCRSRGLRRSRGFDCGVSANSLDRLIGILTNV